MAIKFQLPDLGEDTEGGTVVKVLVAVGDSVEKDQSVIELETDKALLEVPSPASGKVTGVHVAEGDEIRVDALILTIDAAEESDEAPADAPAKPDAQTKAPPAAEPKEAVKVESPPMAKVNPPPAAKVEPSPAPESPRTPAPKPPSSEPGKPEPPRPSTPSAEVVDVPVAAKPAGAGGPASPSTRKLARELGVDLAQVLGSGVAARISKDDVMAFAKSRLAPASDRQSAPGAPGPVAVTPVKLPDFSKYGPIERVKLNGIRKKTIESMTRSWSTIPHVTQFDEADTTDLEALRRRRNEQLLAEGKNKLTATVFVIKACVSALKAFPQFNSSLDVAAGEMIRKDYINIGMAVDTEHGLLVPVLKDVDKKSLLQLSDEIKDLSDRARRRKVSLDDLRGATFTVTNLGGLGGTAFTPIINHPEVAILGLARSQKRVFMIGKQFESRLMLPLCLSYDHRLIDGSDAVRFTRKIAEMLEDPGLLLLEG